MWHYRDLLFFLVGRDIKIRYRQTVLGILWAVLQPLAGMVIFTIFFNKMAGIESGGEAPIRSSPTRGSWRGRSSRTQS
jgi:lipopolysaccharide transport system permease protein